MVDRVSLCPARAPHWPMESGVLLSTMARPDGAYHVHPTMSFRSLYRHGFVRVAACTTRTALADPATNAATILEMARSCHAQGVALAVFPELGLSGYAISDLLQQTALLDAVEVAVDTVAAASAAWMPL